MAREAVTEETSAKNLRIERFACQLKTLSEVIRESQVERIDLLKVDVEKSELDVLAGIDEDDWPKIGGAHPEHAWVIGEWYALRFTGCAAMAMLCRDVEARKRARARIELMQRAEAARSDNPYA